MTYQDAWAICTKCGGQFVFRIEDQRQQVERGEEITPPQLCPSCRGSGHAQRPPRPPSPARTKHPLGQRSGPPPELGPGPHEGNVKWYDPEKGYGFILHSDGEEVFFHRTGIAPGETPRFPDGAKVTYLIEQTEKGPQAVDVARMDAGDSGE